jgi:ELWxxDGT repeat protein
MKRFFSILLVAVVLVSWLAGAQPPVVYADPTGPQLLGDFRPGSGSSNPLFLFPASNRIFYVPDIQPTSGQLWVTDGTPQGTQSLNAIVKEVYYPTLYGTKPPFLLASGGTAYFVASDPATGIELWKSDGTPGGTGLVADLMPGISHGYPNAMVEAGGQLFFIASGDNPYDRGLYRTDGSASGTVKISDWGMDVLKEDLAVFQQRVYFFGEDKYSHYGLWRTNAGGSSVELVKNYSGLGSPADSKLTIWNGRLFFTVLCETGGICIWSSDGTLEGTQIFANLGSSINLPKNLIGAGNWLYFMRSAGSTCEVWRTDGTPSGTGALFVDYYNQCWQSFIALGNDVFFIKRDPNLRTELWKIDGASGLPALVHPLISVITSFELQLDRLVVKDGWLYFPVFKTGSIAELWRTQGEPETTSLVKSFGRTSIAGQIVDLTLWQDTLAFAAPDNTHGQELWTSDGTLAGTQFLVDTNLTPEGSYFHGGLFFNGSLYFGLEDTSRYGNLWRSNGTPQGTVQLAATEPFGLEPNSNSNKLLNSPPAALQGKLYFLTLGDQVTEELWQTDGTPAGTHCVKVLTAPGEASGFGQMAASDGKYLYFSLRNPTDEIWKFWRSDGTPDGTVLLPNTIADKYLLSSFFTINQRVIFGYGLWAGGGETTMMRSTPAGTLEVFASLPINLMADYSDWRSFSTFDGHMYFTAGPRAPDTPLYRTDGETIQEIHPAGSGAAISQIMDLTVSGDRLYISGTSGSTTGLWNLAAGASEASLVQTFPASPNTLVGLSDRVIFHVPGGANGDVLWVSDGSAQGTHSVCPACVFTPGFPAAAYMHQMYFAASDAEHGMELWVTDGTAPGTRLAADINPGPASSNPYYLQTQANLMFFSANDGVHGYEPWVLLTTLDHAAYLPAVRR